MFGAGIGIGMLTYSTAEPIFHFASNPEETIQGISTPLDADNVRNAYKWALLHYGLTPWACYGVIGIALGYLRYGHAPNHSLRSAAVIWLIDFRMARTSRRYCRHFGDSDWAGRHNRLRGFAVFCRPVQYQRLFVSDERQWPTDAERPDHRLGFDRQRVVFVGPVGDSRGIRWLSNINMGLSIFLVSFFILFGSTAFALMTFGYAIWDYLLALPAMSVTVWQDTSSEVGAALQQWQGAWNILLGVVDRVCTLRRVISGKGLARADRPSTCWEPSLCRRWFV